MTRKLMSLLVALTFVLSLVPVVQAQSKSEPAKPAEAATPAEPMKADPAKKSEPAKKAQAKKEKSHQLTGIVEAVDDAAGTLTVKGRQTSVSLKASDKVDLSQIKVGEKVLVQYRGDTAYSLKKVAAKKATPRKTAKKEKAPATAPAGK